ncbi:hypothetical protein OEZ85_005255 [Tetradesmus obliquus]|uniref:Uncharacterized protein n=1 Tax=Tetradesmus obliquus TaxID=3088 RepID=A0ABY8UKZ3_TETOB|nr:hypothetical protein OEZ85_005255 [Tetradesmus obliquus]
MVTGVEPDNKRVASPSDDDGNADQPLPRLSRSPPGSSKDEEGTAGAQRTTSSTAQGGSATKGPKAEEADGAATTTASTSEPEHQSSSQQREQPKQSPNLPEAEEVGPGTAGAQRNTTHAAQAGSCRLPLPCSAQMDQSHCTSQSSQV